MDRKHALKVLGLQDGATPEEINRRVNVLYKKFHQQEKDESGNTLKDVEEAHNLLSGITFRDKEAEKQKKYRQEHPNPFFKLLKVDEEKARNFIYYHKWHALVGVILLGIVLSVILTIVNHVDPSIRVLVTGDVFLNDTEPMEMRLVNEVPNIEAAQVQNVYLSSNNDPQMQAAMQTKFFVEVTEGRNDIFIMDETNYRDLAKQGVFKPLDELIKELGVPDSVLNKSGDLKVAIEAEEEAANEPMQYGLDVTGSAFLNETGVLGERMIIALGPGEHYENALNYLKYLLGQGLGQ